MRRPLGGNAQHYGALKHLAANVGTNASKKNLLFTRNTQFNAQKMTSFDENVRVNQIRETGAVNQKFNENYQIGGEKKTRFSGRHKSYGSACMMIPQTVKNKPLFSGVGEKKMSLQPFLKQDSRKSSVERTESAFERNSSGAIKYKQKYLSTKKSHSNANSPQKTPKSLLQ